MFTAEHFHVKCLGQITLKKGFFSGSCIKPLTAC